MTYENKIRYWGPMRTGSRVVARFLKSIGFQGDHSHNLDWNGEEELWISVRNPYWRAVSWWIIRHGISHWIDGEGVRHEPQRMSFKDWVMSDNEYFSQGMYEDDGWDTINRLKQLDIQPTYLIRSERVYEDLMTIPFVRERMTQDGEQSLKTIDVPYWKDHYRDEYKELDYSTLYTEELAERVWNKKQYETFGLYDKESWRTFR
jgi:hypothetical protein